MGTPSHGQVTVEIHLLGANNAKIQRRRITLSESCPSITCGRASSNPHKGLQPFESNALFDSAIMSRIHARITLDVEKRAVYLTDLKSMHGTFHPRGHKLKPGIASQLQTGSRVAFGARIRDGSKTYDPQTFRVMLSWPLPPFPPLPKHLPDFMTASSIAHLSTPAKVFSVPDAADEDELDQVSVEEVNEVTTVANDRSDSVEVVQSTFRAFSVPSSVDGSECVDEVMDKDGRDEENGFDDVADDDIDETAAVTIRHDNISENGESHHDQSSEYAGDDKSSDNAPDTSPATTPDVHSEHGNSDMTAKESMETGSVSLPEPVLHNTLQESSIACNIYNVANLETLVGEDQTALANRINEVPETCPIDLFADKYLLDEMNPEDYMVPKAADAFSNDADECWSQDHLPACEADQKDESLNNNAESSKDEDQNKKRKADQMSSNTDSYLDPDDLFSLLPSAQTQAPCQQYPTYASRHEEHRISMPGSTQHSEHKRLKVTISKAIDRPPKSKSNMKKYIGSFLAGAAFTVVTAVTALIATAPVSVQEEALREMMAG